MVDAEGRTMADRGEFVDAEGRKQGEEGFDFETAERQGGYDASTGKMDTEGSFEGYRQDYKRMRGMMLISVGIEMTWVATKMRLIN